MMESWGDVCAHCAELLAGVPLYVVVTTGLASLVGLFVLVWSIVSGLRSMIA